MIWATVCSWSCFCWLYRASPSWAAKNINQSDFGIDHLVMFMCRIFSCVVGRGCLLWSVHSLGKTLSLCPASLCTPRPNFPVTPGISWIPTFAFQSLWWKGHLFLALVLEGLVGLHRTIRLQLVQHTGWGIDLDYCDTEWFALGKNRDHSVVFEITPKYCIFGLFCWLWGLLHFF